MQLAAGARMPFACAHALLLLLNQPQSELDLNHHTKLRLGVKMHEEHDGALYLAGARLVGVAFACYTHQSSCSSYKK